jgi:beta-lactamase regulating signal transducer with metallopeptidase domain
MTPTAMQASASLLAHLANPAARALALALAAGIGLAVLRVRSTSARLFTWTAVLYAALAMPLLGRLLPPVPLPTPAFFHGARQPIAKPFHGAHPPVTRPVSSAAGRTFATPLATARPEAPPSFRWSSIPWTAVAARVYLAVACLLLVRFFVGLALSRRLMQRSRIIDEPRIALRLASFARGSGLVFIPEAAESEFISVPVTMGALRSTILLPAGWREWDDAKLDAVIAHEMSHVARRDAITQRLSLLHRAIFWFSPLAWWLDRHLAALAEQASDEAALSCGADRKDYARILLEFFEALQAAPGRVWWQGVSMANADHAEQRVERILAWKGAVAMSLKKSIAAVIVALAVPVVYLSAAVHPANYNLGAQEVAPAQAQTPPPAPPDTHPAHPSKASSDHGFSYFHGYDEDQRFVIASGKTDSLTMSGTTEDEEMVEELRKQIHGDFLWFERDGKSYIIRDQTTIDRARKFWAPQEELGKKQEELGEQQEALGKQQEELGEKMEQIHVRVPDMTAELEKLKTELQKLNDGATMEQVGEIQSEIGELQSKVGDLQSQAGERQSKLGEQQSALGEKQGRLGEQQGELGRRQGELARQALRQMRQLFDEAIKKGTATVLRGHDGEP